jgi:hypothetical protein
MFRYLGGMFRRAWVPALLFVAACGDATPAPITPKPAPGAGAPSTASSSAASASALPVASTAQPPPAPPAACVVRGLAGVLVRPIALRYHGRRFGSIDTIRSAEARLAAPPGTSTLRAKTNTLEFNGEVALDDVFVAPDTRQVSEGWYVVEALRARSVSATEITGTSSLPSLLSGPAPIESKHRCDAVTLTVPDWTRARTGTSRVLKAGARSSLRDAANGKVLAQLAVPAAKAGNKVEQLVGVLEEAGSAAKLALRGPDLSVLAWVDGASLVSANYAEGKRLLLAAQAESMELQLLAALGTPQPNRIACPDPVTVYVRDGADRAAVATVLPNGPIKKTGASDASGAELGIDLGAVTSADLAPFVLRADVGKCGPALEPNGLAVLGGQLGAQVPSGSVPTDPGLTLTPGGEVKVKGPKGEASVGAVNSSGNVTGVERVMAGLRPRFRACYQSGVNANPAMTGKLVLRVETSTTGEVIKADISSNTGMSAAVATCVASAVRRAAFSGDGVITAPILFTVAEH